jgi:hypothetical protein
MRRNGDGVPASQSVLVDYIAKGYGIYDERLASLAHNPLFPVARRPRILKASRSVTGLSSYSPSVRSTVGFLLP